MLNFSYIPGLQPVKELLRTSVLQNKLPHTQLFTSPDGGAGLAMAIAFSKYIACENRSTDSCGKCITCLQFDHGNYPEFFLFFPYVKTTALGKEKIESSQELLNEFYSALKENPFLTKSSWQRLLETGNKQFIIPVTESERIIKIIQTKAAATRRQFFS